LSGPLCNAEITVKRSMPILRHNRIRVLESQLRIINTWYWDIALDYPSTYSGIEATNNVIKNKHTLQQRLPVGQFLNNSLRSMM